MIPLLRNPLIGLAALVIAASAQQPGARPAYDGADAPDVARQIYIDGDCRIIPDAAHPFPGRKLKPFRDNGICSLETVLHSEHVEEQIKGNQLLRWAVRVNEQTFVLQNITGDHIVFVVEYRVPAGWTVDSDPQPNRYAGSTAIFPVHAQPGEIVRLHVGVRHTTPLKPRAISNP